VALPAAQGKSPAAELALIRFLSMSALLEMQQPPQTQAQPEAQAHELPEPKAKAKTRFCGCLGF
jgi:hypothetical protein